MPSDSMTSADYQQLALSDYMGQVGTAAINAASSKKERKAAQKHAEKMALESYQRDIEFWEKVNEYNSPLQKRLRLEEAGISPWTEYGQMNTEAPMIKSPVAETLTPTQGLQLPAINLLGPYLAIRKAGMEEKAVQAGLERTAVETKYKQLETDILQEYKNRQMINDLVFSQDVQSEARKEWNRVADAHQQKMDEYEREKEKFAHEKSLYKYDEPAQQLRLLEQRKKLSLMEEQLKEFQLKAEDIKQKYRIGAIQEKQAQSDYETSIDKEKTDKYFRDERKRIKEEYGIDMENTGWWTKTATELSDYINKSVDEFKEKQRKRTENLVGNKTYRKRFNPYGL